MNTRTMLDGVRAEKEGIISGYVVKYDVVDSYNTIFQSGSFKKTISERSELPLLWNHNRSEVIGRTLSMVEDAIGVQFRAKLNLAVQRAREVYDQIVAGDVRGVSFHFEPIKYTKGTPLVFKEVKVNEVSLTAFPAVPGAEVSSIRSIVDNALTAVVERQPDSQEHIDKAISMLRALVQEPSTPEEPDTPAKVEPQIEQIVADYLARDKLSRAINNYRNTLAGDKTNGR